MLYATDGELLEIERLNWWRSLADFGARFFLAFGTGFGIAAMLVWWWSGSVDFQASMSAVGFAVGEAARRWELRLALRVRVICARIRERGHR